MRSALLDILLLNGQANPYQSYIASLNPAIWYRFNETSGNAQNYGSAANQSGVLTSTTQGVTGKLGANEAYTFDGANSKVTANGGSGADFTTFTFAALVKANSNGESTSGSIFAYGTGGTTRHSRYAGGTSLRFTVYNAALSFVFASVTLTTAAWTWVFGTYDDSGDRIARLTTGKNSALTNGTASSALTGTLESMSAFSLVVGNNSGQTLTWDGQIDEFMFFPSILSDTQKLSIVTLTNT